MESDRRSQTTEELADVIEVITIPDDDPPSSEDSNVPSVSSSCLSSSSSSVRVADYSQSPFEDFRTRPELNSHLTSGVNTPTQLPTDSRRETQTTGEATVNTSTAFCRPDNVPAMSACYSSQATSTQPAQLKEHN